MKTAQCPSCGAPVEFRSTASIYAVCAYCQSTLLRDGESLKNLGRMADLMEDQSRIQIGTAGRFRGHAFTVIGRIQLQYGGGFWNEWHILFDDARGAWLSEAGGDYAVTVQAKVNSPLPAFASLRPQALLEISGHRFTVTDLATARCIAGQGELPFGVRAGYDVDTADLRGDGRFVTIDYSETPPLVFVGHPAGFADLALTNLRDIPLGPSAPTVKARDLKCPDCGASLSVHSGAIESVACRSCGAVSGIEHDGVALLAKATKALRYDPWLVLGSRGTLNGIDWEAIGFLRRTTRSGGETYSWSEYLLFNAEQGFAWLTEYQGHWNFVRTLAHPPVVASGQKEFKHLGMRFKRFSAGPAEVSYVLGEFYWRVAVGESALVEDYVSPPIMLSREVTDKEVSWSQARYLEPDALCRAFAIKTTPPRQTGVFANQPNPYTAPHRSVFRLFLGLVLGALLLQFLFLLLSPSAVLLRQSFQFIPSAAETTLATDAFELPKGARALAVTHETTIENNWVDIATTLVEKTTGAAREGAQTISYYQGVDGGERWSEGSRDGTLAFHQVPPGTYYLAIEPELGTDRRDAVSDALVVRRNPAAWSNFWLLMAFLVVFPLVSRWRRNRFEAKRWSESGDAAADSGSDTGADGDGDGDD